MTHKIAQNLTGSIWVQLLKEARLRILRSKKNAHFFWSSKFFQSRRWVQKCISDTSHTSDTWFSGRFRAVRTCRDLSRQCRDKIRKRIVHSITGIQLTPKHAVRWFYPNLLSPFEYFRLDRFSTMKNPSLSCRDSVATLSRQSRDTVATGQSSFQIWSKSGVGNDFMHS